MLITKFNKMIRNKLIWGFIAIVISVFFVLSFSSMRGCSPSSPDAVGKLYGEEITQRALRVSMFFELGLQSDSGLGQDAYDELRHRTWQRLAILRTAERLGLTTPDAEVTETIANEPGFAENGVFQKQRYAAFVRQRGVDPDTFAEFLRQDITMQKVRSLLDAVVWTAPSEVERRLLNLTDERDVEYAVFERGNFTTDLDLSDEEIRAYFDGNSDAFAIPERIQVRYVSFPYADFASTNVSESAVQAYYDDNIERYTPEDTNQFDFSEILPLDPQPLPLDDVRGEIVALIQERDAMLAAKDAATDFVITLPPDRRGQRPTFEESAASTGLTVRICEPFGIGEDVPGLDVDARFVDAAFRLIPGDPEAYFSDAILASNAAFVIAFHKMEDSRIPEFEEVSATVTPLARSNKLAEAFAEHVNQAREAVTASTADDTDFKSILEGYDATVTNAVFSVYGSLLTNAFEHQDMLVPEVVELEAGDVSDVVAADEVALIARIITRVPSEPVEGYSLRAQLLRTLQGYRAGILFSDYGEYVLEAAGFEDLTVPVDGDETEAPGSPAGSDSR